MCPRCSLNMLCAFASFAHMYCTKMRCKMSRNDCPHMVPAVIAMYDTFDDFVQLVCDRKLIARDPSCTPESQHLLSRLHCNSYQTPTEEAPVPLTAAKWDQDGRSASQNGSPTAVLSYDATTWLYWKVHFKTSRASGIWLSTTV
jgi:hypothetical protein